MCPSINGSESIVPLGGDSPTDGGSPSTRSNVLNASFPRLKIRMI